MRPGPAFVLPRRASLAMAALAGVAAMWGGLVWMGWDLPGLDGRQVARHGALAALGFLGTLIAAERATALGRGWAFGAPLASGLGALALLAFPSPVPGQLLMLMGAVVSVAIFAVIRHLQPELHNLVLVSGAVLWAVSVGLWLGGFAPYRVAPWWAGMLVVTIAGERLELTRLIGLGGAARRSFLATLILVVLGLAVSVPWFGPGGRLAGAGLLCLAIWLARHDIARRTIRNASLPRFMAACLLAGYAWLAVAGLMWLSFGGVVAGPRHDAMLHAVLVGFVISMVFAHAPVILPAVLGGSVPYRAWFYAPLVLLHVSLVLRIVGDLAAGPAAIRWGGLLSAAAIVLFGLSVAVARIERREAPGLV